MNPFLNNRLVVGLNEKIEFKERLPFLIQFAVEAAAIIEKRELIIKENKRSVDSALNRVRNSVDEIIGLVHQQPVTGIIVKDYDSNDSPEWPKTD